MSSTVNGLVQQLNAVTYWINQIYPLLQIIFGTFGNVMNIIIFTRRDLRGNPCSLYFLVGSINNWFFIDISLSSRYVSSVWNWDPSATNDVLCKLRTWFIYSPLTLSLWFTVLASIDRFLSSSPNARLRQMSSLPIARKIITITFILVYLIYAHALVYSNSVRSSNGISCISTSYNYVVFIRFFSPIMSCILPITLMGIFGLLMIHNARKIHNRVGPLADNARNVRLRSHDRQLCIMVLFQVLITTLISVPYFGVAVYNTIAVVILQQKLAPPESAIYSFILNQFRLFYYTNPVLSFYIYTLTGPKFRVEMIRCVRYGLNFIITGLGLIRYMPVGAQPILLIDNRLQRTNLLSQTHPSRRRKNVIAHTQPITTMQQTSAL